MNGTEKKDLDLLIEGLQRMALKLSDQMIDQLMTYLNLVEKWNRVYNLTAIRERDEMIRDLEHKFIDKIFEMGDLENLKKDDLKEFITKRVNEKLAELGYTPIKGGDDYFEFDEKKASELDWFYHLTGGVTHTDFFAIRPTDYSKAGEGENWDDIF